jgi:DNA invertase Pin-like site-specific DNA recombinase
MRGQSGCEAIACVIYAAKSTEDRRGSIPDQLQECRGIIEADATRTVAGTYSDEAFSAFHRSRGPGLVDAMQHVGELAHERGEAELWALHSDRLARGDGRSARHAVEIALWGLKRDVKIRTVQDPDTFRDLLYAVVTGQRNHEDSRRRGLASAAGRRRAVERGDYTGANPDGYRRVIEVDENGTIKRRLDIDPARREVIEMIFRLALRGKHTGEIARAVSEAGWLTKPLLKWQRPKPWTIHGVRSVLTNPRHAGLAATKGEVVGSGNWPAYITERQHRRIVSQLARRPSKKGPRPLEPYLLAHLAQCGRCGSTMHCHTGVVREDGTFARRYICSGHHQHRHAGRCQMRPIDADVVEAMFVSTIRSLLFDGTEEIEPAPPHDAAGGSWPDSPERERVLQAVLAGDDPQIDAALEELLRRMSPEVAMLRRIAVSGRNTRQLEAAQRFEAWASTERTGRTEASRAEARTLNRVLRTWFSGVTLALDARSVVIVAHHQSASGAGDSPGRGEAQFDRREWMRWSPVAQRTHRIYAEWEDAEIVGALQAWADAHGHAPRASDWFRGAPTHPSSATVRRHFRNWRRALKRAGLRSSTEPRRDRWDEAEIVKALRSWTAQNGCPPSRSDWIRGGPDRPCKTTVYNHFGSWQAALEAAGLEAVTDQASALAPQRHRSPRP